MACGCLVEALAALAPDPTNSPGLCVICSPHGQVVVWDGDLWRWSNQAVDLGVVFPSFRTSTEPHEKQRGMTEF